MSGKPRLHPLHPFDERGSSCVAAMATDEMAQLLRRINDSMKLGVVCVVDLEKLKGTSTDQSPLKLMEQKWFRIGGMHDSFFVAVYNSS